LIDKVVGERVDRRDIGVIRIDQSLWTGVRVPDERTRMGVARGKQEVLGHQAGYGVENLLSDGPVDLSRDSGYIGSEQDVRRAFGPDHRALRGQFAGEAEVRIGPLRPAVTSHPAASGTRVWRDVHLMHRDGKRGMLGVLPVLAPCPRPEHGPGGWCAITASESDLWHFGPPRFQSWFERPMWSR
jgi:hypothetical protein